MQVNHNYKDNIAFGKFLKVKGSFHDVRKLKNYFVDKHNDVLTLSVKEARQKASLYLFTGKDFDDFIHLTKKVMFLKLRRNIEKYMPNKPKVVSGKKAIKLLDK